MNRMDKVFKEIKERGEKILILYFPIQDSILNDDISWAKKYFDNGCTVLEIGLPNDNPILDGKTVADSMLRALKHSNLNKVFDSIKNIRKKYPDRILQIMVYYHVIEKMGFEEFSKKCYEADVDGVLSPNTPKDKIRLLDECLKKYNIYNLRFVPYNLSNDDLDDLEENSKGYIFQQAVNGTTGAQKTVSKQIEKNVRTIKNRGIETPVCAGFGISNAEQVKEAINMGADGVIVGSATISHIINGDGEEFIHSLGEAVK